MNPQVGAALIGAAGAIIVALITVYHDEISAILFGGGRYHYLKGDWRCTWDVTRFAGGNPEQLQDQISVTRVLGALLWGRGSNSDFGEYRIKGEASEFAVTLSYCGVGDNKLLRGVIILKKVNPRAVQGVWCQYAADGTLKTGATSWTKI